MTPQRSDIKEFASPRLPAGLPRRNQLSLGRRLPIGRLHRVNRRNAGTTWRVIISWLAKGDPASSSRDFINPLYVRTLKRPNVALLLPQPVGFSVPFSDQASKGHQIPDRGHFGKRDRERTRWMIKSPVKMALVWGLQSRWLSHESPRHMAGLLFVGIGMLDHPILPNEPFATDITSERFLSSVKAHVPS